MRILRGVGSGLLPCGCFVGLYETYSGPTVQIVEEQGIACTDPDHKPGAERVVSSDASPVRPVSPPFERHAA